MGHGSLSSPLPDSHFSASPDLWSSVLRELLVEVSQCLHDSRRALHIGVVDHDVACQQVKGISATAPPPWSLSHTPPTSPLDPGHRGTLQMPINICRVGVRRMGPDSFQCPATGQGAMGTN